MEETFEEVREALADRFVVEQVIGHGGMATVYLATELNPRRSVAIKVFETFLSDAVGRKRFLREIEIAARLQHPHIVPIYSAGETEGTLYFVMPYVEGETVRAGLARRGPYSLRDALHVAQDVAGALAFAHEHGIIHRDIKPENILVSRRHALVADFGIAKALSKTEFETLTRTGFSMGTPRYMSPEQERGEAVDGRADIYALGRVLYEMLFGSVPADAKKLGVEDRANLATVPLEVAMLVERCLFANVSDRFADAPALLAAIKDARRDGVSETVQRRNRNTRARWFAAGLAAVTLAAFSAFRLAAPKGAQPSPRVAVLPFTETVPTGASVAVGFDSVLAGRLLQVGEVTVLSVPAAATSLPRETLQADFALEGTIRWEEREAETVLSVSVLLYRLDDLSLIWSGAFAGSLGDTLAMRSNVADSVAAAVRLGG
jgi:serine/threonine-protein kinase